MDSHLAAVSFENAFDSNYLRNWCIAKGTTKQPEAHEGYTQIIANDRGHLLPSVPRSKANPWGTFMGTWQMPLQIPPARINLTARSTAAANRLLNWVQKNPDLLNASNGLCPEIRGHPQDSGPRGNRNTPKPQEKTATPKAVQETPPSSPAANSPAAKSPVPTPPPSRSLSNASPAPHPPPNQICSCYCTCCCCSPAKIAPKRSLTPEAYSSSNEPEDQEIQERNIENEEPQQEKGAPAPLSTKKITE
ncbi:protein Flattop isoform 2-T2 [Sarcophilus harrisii]